MANKRIEQIVENWKEILDEGKQYKSQKVRRATAVMLENQLKFMRGRVDEGTTWNGGSMDPNTAGYSGNGEFHKIAIPMVRRTFPELIAHDIVGVQPLTGPVGLAFALRFVADQDYTNGPEVGYNAIDKDYSGSYHLSAGEALGSDAGDGTTNSGHLQVGDNVGLGIGTGQHIKELSMTIEKQQVEARTRKLRSRWSLEVAQDIKAMHGLDLEEEMMDILAYEITAEIDRELIGVIRALCTNANNNNSTWNYKESDGRWENEKYRNLYNMIIRKANNIATRTRRGAGNYVIASPSMCAALEALDGFAAAPVDTDINTSVTGVARIGSLGGRMTVYRDTFATTDEVLIGYKGVSEYDTGVVYLPYIQLMQMRATYEDSFNPAVGLMSRYAILEHLFGAENYYQRITAEDLYVRSDAE